MTTVDPTSVEPSPHPFPLWPSAVGVSYDIAAAFGGQPARYLSVAVGGTLMLKSPDTAGYVPHVVTSGQTVVGQFSAVEATGSTAYGLTFWK